MGKDERPAGALALPKLKPRSATVGPFSRSMAAIVEAGVDQTPQLVRQAQHAPPAKQRIAAVSEAKDQQMARVHTRIPTPLMVELQVYCARNRTQHCGSRRPSDDEDSPRRLLPHDYMLFVVPRSPAACRSAICAGSWDHDRSPGGSPTGPIPCVARQ